MGLMQRRKGKSFENKCVRDAKEAGLDARRTAMMQTQDGVETFGDLTINGERYEAKNQEAIGSYIWKWLGINKGLIIKKNGLMPLVVIPYADYLELLKDD